MFVTGLLSLFQILLLPGLIINSFIKKQTGFFYRFCFIVAISLLINFIWVLFLVLIKAYVFEVVLGSLVFEVALIIFLYRKNFTLPIKSIFSSLSTRMKSSFSYYFESSIEKRVSQKILVWIKSIALALALLTIGWILFDFVNQIGTVFTRWDSVLSYNRWATEWSHGLFPTGACEYPQLLTTNWSLTYVFTNSTVVIFAKLVQSIFPLLFVFAMFDLALSLGSAGFMFVVPLSIILLKKFAGVSLFEGYMDVAVTTLTLLSFYMIIKDHKRNSYTQNTIWLSGTVILAAALTKQPGALAFGAWVLINFFITLSMNPRQVWKAIKKIVVPASVFLLLIASWYVFKMKHDELIGEMSCLAVTNSWAANDLKKGFFEVLLFRFKLLNLWGLFVPLLVISIFFAKKPIRTVFLCYGIPYLLLSLSYGFLEAFIRYLTPISFIFAMSAGVIIDWLINCLIHFFNNLPVDRIKYKVKKWVSSLIQFIQKLLPLPIWVILILGLVIVAFVGFRYSDSKLVRNFEYQQMEIGNREINEYLVEFYKDKNPKDMTLTWYPFLNYLPGLEGRSEILFSGDVNSISEQIKNDGIRYILKYNTTPGEISEYFSNLEKQGQLTIITDFGVKNDAVLYEVSK